MHEDRTRRGRTLCANCQYPLLRLDGFEGDSSRDAPVFGNRISDGSAVLNWGLLLLPWRLLKGLWSGSEAHKRQKQVQRLRADILPEAPDAMICPMCLRVAFPDELHG